MEIGFELVRSENSVELKDLVTGNVVRSEEFCLSEGSSDTVSAMACTILCDKGKRCLPKQNGKRGNKKAYLKSKQ